MICKDQGAKFQEENSQLRANNETCRFEVTKLKVEIKSSM